MNTFDLHTLTEGITKLEDGIVKVTIRKPGGFTYQSGDYTVHGYTYNTVIDAVWEFADGLQIHARNAADQITYRKYGRDDRTRRNELTKKTRVYVSADIDFNVLEDLENRCRRPHDLYRAPALDALRRIGLDEVKMNWSQYAGCSCPCSPGFILTGGPTMGIDIWITVPGLPTVDESKPGREVVLN